MSVYKVRITELQELAIGLIEREVYNLSSAIVLMEVR